MELVKQFDKFQPARPVRKECIAVAMSGGVDSSMAAVILKEEGYEVIGLTMDLGNPVSSKESPSSGEKVPSGNLGDARRVAEQIGISHTTIDLREEFEQNVVQYFVSEYMKGRTPNPCIRCNERIKFRFLLEKAQSLGARALATGHYARIKNFSGEKQGTPTPYLLLRGKDRKKDQSYFLFSLSQEQLSRIIFPLGERTKEEVRAEARKRRLRVAERAESQEICFIPENDYRRFLENRMGKKFSQPGPIVNRERKVLGFHRGLHSFTIGQRRGLRIAAPHPLYVLALEPEENRVVAGSKEELSARGLVAHDVHWISFPNLAETIEVLVQIRYRHPEIPAVLSPLGGEKIRVEFGRPQKSITPGQAAVFYRGDEVLGGGWIEKAL